MIKRASEEQGVLLFRSPRVLSAAKFFRLFRLFRRIPAYSGGLLTSAPSADRGSLSAAVHQPAEQEALPERE